MSIDELKDQKIMMTVLVVILILSVAIGSMFFYQPPVQRYEKRTEMMGTYVRITVYHNDEELANDAIDSAFERMREVNPVASRYNPSSELYRLNDQGHLENASPMLLELIEKSIYIYNITDGAFDITVTPLLNLWSNELELSTLSTEHKDSLNNGTLSAELRDELNSLPIHPLNETPVITSTANGWTLSSSWQNYFIYDHGIELIVKTNFWNLPYDTQGYYIEETQQYVGSDKIHIDGNSIRIQEGMSLTLDGIAKGYAVDRAIEELKSKGIESALVDAGGDIRTLGTRPRGEKWTVGLRNPEDASDSIMEFSLSGQAIATSGNYERYFDEDARVGHIMDPNTGRSVLISSSATVIAEDCVTADALATAVFVLGPENGTRLVNSLSNTESLIIGYDYPCELYGSDGLSKYTDA